MSLKSSIQKKSIKRKQKGGTKGGSFVLVNNPSSGKYMYDYIPDEGIEEVAAAAVVAAASNSKKTLNGVESLILAVAKQQQMLNDGDYVGPAAGPAAADAAIDDGSAAAADAAAADAAAADAADKSKKTVRSKYNEQYRDFQRVQEYKETNTFTAAKLDRDCEGKQNLMYGCYYKNRVFSIIYNEETQQYGILKDDSLQRSFNFFKTTASSISESELVYFDKLQIKIVSKKECKMVFFLEKVKQDLDIKIKKNTLQGILKNIPNFDTLVDDTIVELNMTDLSKYNQYVEDLEPTELLANPKIEIEFVSEQAAPAIAVAAPANPLDIYNEGVNRSKNTNAEEEYELEVQLEPEESPSAAEEAPAETVDGPNLKEARKKVEAVVKPFTEDLTLSSGMGTTSEKGGSPPHGGRKYSRGSRKARTKLFKGSKKVHRA